MNAKQSNKLLSTSWKIVITIAILAALILGLLLFQYIWNSQNDKNGDGKADEWMRFNLKGQKVEFRRDKNFDEKVDYIEYYRKGRINKIRVDFNYDGYFETTGFYSDKAEILLKLERDTDMDGRADRRTIFDETTGTALRVEIDTYSDGIFDKTLKDTKGETDE